MTKSKQATSAKQWRSKSSIKATPTPVEVPSGNTALVRAPGVETFFKLGFIPNSLLAVMSSVKEGQSQADLQKKLDEVFADMTTDPTKLKEVFDLADAVTVYCCVEPKVLEAPEDPEDRDEDCLYVDEVEINDKMFIMQYAMSGVKDLEPFRDGQSKDVVDVPDSQDVDMSS